MPVLTSTEMRERVARGVALLDEHVPDWRDRIDPNRLNMIDGCRCVLGQVFDAGPFAVESGYWIGAHELGLWDDIHIEQGMPVWSIDWFGFAISNLHQVNALRQCWLRQLECVPA